MIKLTIWSDKIRWSLLDLQNMVTFPTRLYLLYDEVIVWRMIFSYRPCRRCGHASPNRYWGCAAARNRAAEDTCRCTDRGRCRHPRLPCPPLAQPRSRPSIAASLSRLAAASATWTHRIMENKRVILTSSILHLFHTDVFSKKWIISKRNGV